MPRVTYEDLRKLAHTTDTDLDDAICKILCKQAEVVIEGMAGVSLNYGNCTETARQAMLLQALLGAIDYLKRGTTVASEAVDGYSLGPLSVTAKQSSGSQVVTSIDEIKAKIAVLVGQLEPISLTVGEADST